MWYLIGPAIVAAYLLAAFILILLLGATMARPFPIPSAGTMILLFWMCGLWEEPGWTGYAVPNCRNGLSLTTIEPCRDIGIGILSWALASAFGDLRKY